MRYLLVLSISVIIVASADAQCEFPLHTGDLWQLIDNFPMVHIVHEVRITGLTEKSGHVYSTFSGFAPYLNQTIFASPEISCMHSTIHQSTSSTILRLPPATPSVSGRLRYCPGCQGQHRRSRENAKAMDLPRDLYSPMPFNDNVRHVIDSIGMSYLNQATGGQTYYLAGALINGVQYGKITDVGAGPKETPTVLGLAQNYPNPFNPSTRIRYGLPNRSMVTLTVFNTLGQRVAVLQNGEQEAGYHEVTFEGKNLSSGLYFYRLQAGDFVETKRFLLLR